MANILEVDRNLGLLRKYSSELQDMMEDGSFYRLGFRERFKLVRRVKKLYTKLRGPASALKLKHVVAAAGVLALNTACFVPVGVLPDLRTGGTDDPGSTATGGGGFSLTPYFSPRGFNPYGIKPIDDWTVTEDPNTQTVTYRIPVGAASAFVDLDGDGDLDVVHSGAYLVYTFNFYDETASYSWGAEITWQENTGTPTDPQFGPAQPFPVDTVNVAGGPAFADMDNDGDQDLWIATSYVDIPYVEYAYLEPDGLAFFENVGDAFNPAFEFRGTFGGYGAIYDTQDVAVGDIDGDGDLDLLVSNDGVTVYENTGTPEAPEFSFNAPSEESLGSAFGYMWNPAQMVLVDVDRDGDLDLISTGFNYGEVDVLINEGDGLNPLFNTYYDYGMYLGYGYRIGYPRVVDIDGDGDLDVFVFGNYSEGYYYGGGYKDSLFFFENLMLGESTPR